MTREVPFLNGLRGVAAMWVMGAHCMIWGGWTLTAIPDPKIAVDLFMLISGYLMSMNARARATVEPMSQPLSWAMFYIRRYFRLAPAYYASLMLAILVAGPFFGGYRNLQALNPRFWGVGGSYDASTFHFTAINVVTHVSFVFGILPRYVDSSGLPDWSLSLEMQFYLVFPFLYLAMRRYGAIPVAIMASVAAYIITGFSAGTFPEPSFLPLKLSVFLAGILIAELSWARGRFLPWLFACAALVIPFMQVSNYGVQFPLLLFVTASMVALSAPALSASAFVRRLKGLCGGSAAQFFSDVSYGIYLFHGFFIAGCGYVLFGNTSATLSGDQRTLIIAAIVFPASIATGWLSHTFIERPSTDVGRSVVRAITSRVTAPADKGTKAV